MKLKQYSEFMKLLNKNKIDWCLIKDYDYLIKNGYDNELDLIAMSKDRHKIRNVAKQNGWNESVLNTFNSHLIFWKFEGLKPFRIDMHMNKALATAIPWLGAKDILATKVKKGDICVISPVYELALLLMGSFRGRNPKPHRVKKAKELKNYLSDVKLILTDKLSGKEIERYYTALTSERIVSFSKLKRLGLLGIIKEKALLLRLLLLRIINPARVIRLNLDKNQLTAFKHIMINSKINFKIIASNSRKFLFFERLNRDLIITISSKEKKIDLVGVLKKIYSANSS